MQLILAETSCRRTIACFFEGVIEFIYDSIHFLSHLNPWILALLVFGLIIVVFVLVILLFVAFNDKSETQKEQSSGDIIAILAFQGAFSYWQNQRKNKAKKKEKIASNQNKENLNKFKDLAIKEASSYLQYRQNNQDSKKDTVELKNEPEAPTKATDKQKDNWGTLKNLAVQGVSSYLDSEQKNKQDKQEEPHQKKEQKGAERRKILGKTAKFIANKYIK